MIPQLQQPQAPLGYASHPVKDTSFDGGPGFGTVYGEQAEPSDLAPPPEAKQAQDTAKPEAANARPSAGAAAPPQASPVPSEIAMVADGCGSAETDDERKISPADDVGSEDEDPAFGGGPLPFQLPIVVLDGHLVPAVHGPLAPPLPGMPFAEAQEAATDTPHPDDTLPATHPVRASGVWESLITGSAKLVLPGALSDAVPATVEAGSLPLAQTTFPLQPHQSVMEAAVRLHMHAEAASPLEAAVGVRMHAEAASPPELPKPGVVVLSDPSRPPARTEKRDENEAIPSGGPTAQAAASAKAKAPDSGPSLHGFVHPAIASPASPSNAFAHDGVVGQSAAPDALASDRTLLVSVSALPHAGTALSQPLRAEPATLPVADLPRTLAEHAASAGRAGSGSVEVVLNPQELGRLRFEMQHQGDHLRVILVAERPETLDLLRRHGDQLLTDLRQSGFAGASLSFGSWGQQGQSSRPQGVPAAFQPADETASALPPPVPQSAAGSGLDIRY